MDQKQEIAKKISRAMDTANDLDLLKSQLDVLNGRVNNLQNKVLQDVDMETVKAEAPMLLEQIMELKNTITVKMQDLMILHSIEMVDLEGMYAKVMELQDIVTEKIMNHHTEKTQRSLSIA